MTAITSQSEVHIDFKLSFHWTIHKKINNKIHTSITYQPKKKNLILDSCMKNLQKLQNHTRVKSKQLF